jgi:hypothetical protein
MSAHRHQGDNPPAAGNTPDAAGANSRYPRTPKERDRRRPRPVTHTRVCAAAVAAAAAVVTPGGLDATRPRFTRGHSPFNALRMTTGVLSRASNAIKSHQFHAVISRACTPLLQVFCRPQLAEQPSLVAACVHVRPAPLLARAPAGIHAATGPHCDHSTPLPWRPSCWPSCCCVLPPPRQRQATQQPTHPW